MMNRSIRRIVTGHNRRGRSCLLSDERLSPANATDLNVWMCGPGERGHDLPFFPRGDNAIFRIVTLPTPDTSTTPADLARLAEQFFASTGSPSCRLDTARHPLMHVTPTTDFILVLSGEVALLLDEGPPLPLAPMDTVVQRATNHAWLVCGAAPAVLLCVLVGEDRPGQPG